MFYLYFLTGWTLLISFLVDKQNTIKAIRIAYRKFIKILPAFLGMLIAISFVLFLIPEKTIASSLGNGNRFISVLLASLIGSVTLMPGPIAYPFCGILLKEGVSYMVVSAFSTTLMMVGVLTYSIEKEYFGVRITIIRNVVSFLIALVVALAMGLFFGELL